MKQAAVILLVMVLATGATFADILTFDAADDFLLSNPNGAWSYGSTASPGSAFGRFTSTSTAFFGTGILAHNTSGTSFNMPAVFKNPNATTTTVFGTLFMAAGSLAMHPGNVSPTFTVTRWTAPQTGDFNIFGGFSGAASATTDVHLLHNGASIFSDNINGLGDTALFSQTVSFSSEDTLDFVVGDGGNGFGSDSTGLNAQITSIVPEPATYALFGLVSICIFALRNRHRAPLKFE